jgi:methionyl aminopeptidase
MRMLPNEDRETTDRRARTMDGGGDARRITIHAPEDFAGMRAAGRLAAETLDMITPHVLPGVNTGALDKL